MAEKRFTAGIGAANMDLHGRSRAALILHDSNPGFLHTSPGGVTRNILENLSRMGERTALFSAIGNDLYGREILASGEAVGMDMSHMLRCPDCGGLLAPEKHPGDQNEGELWMRRGNNSYYGLVHCGCGKQWFARFKMARRDGLHWAFARCYEAPTPESLAKWEKQKRLMVERLKHRTEKAEG